MRSRAAFAVIVGAAWLILLAVFVPVPIGAPLRPAEITSIAGSSFVSVIGGGERSEDALAVTGLDPVQGALQVRALEPVEAASRSTLRYAFRNLPRALELVFVYREQGSEDVQALTLPVGRSGHGAIDLSRVPAWRGRIVEIGFAQYPAAQSVSPATDFPVFELVEAQLESRSWSGALAVRRTDWFGARNWQLLSLSALGPDGALPAGRALVPMFALGIGCTLLLGMWLRGWRGGRLARAAVAAMLAAWLLLDVRWLADLSGRLAGTREVYAALPGGERMTRVPDQVLHDTARDLRQRLSGEAAGTRVLVDAGSDYERARLLYHLLPLNAAPLYLPAGTDAGGSLVVLYAAPRYRFDAAAGTLFVGSEAHRATEVLDQGPLRVYRLAGASP